MTNEEYIKAIEMRRSRRTFRTTALDEQTLAVIDELVKTVNEKAGLNFILVKDGSYPFKVLSGRFSYIAVCGPDTEKARIQCGYWGEMIVLQCVYHGLGTCWVTGSYDENKIYETVDIPKNLRLYATIAIGYVKDTLSTKEKVMHSATHKQSKPYQKMFDVCDAKLPPYYEYGMKLVEKAPSQTNSRPVHFKYENGVISAFVDAPYSDKSIDFGIAQLHFRLGAAAKGLKGEWDFTGRFCSLDSKVIKFPEPEKDDGSLPDTSDLAQEDADASDKANDDNINSQEDDENE